ncbi:fimbria/pilus outer membrane usher protein [Phenylobacterium sp.]|uniref:fimbria/pilus outer membrane usher protein n=1 Tax=Phenylobacterium sp. TaxID=1871053 RepID=UPI002F40D8D7
MPTRESWLAPFVRLALGLIALVLCGCAATCARAGDEVLQLEVVINEAPTNMIGEFVLRDGATLSRREELTSLGLRVPPSAPQTLDGLVILSAIPGVAVRLDRATQMLFLTIPQDLLTPHLLTAVGRPVPEAPLQSGTGITLNYDVSGAFGDHADTASGLFDLRAFSPWGVASTTFLAHAGLRPAGSAMDEAIRLDSTYVYSDFASQRRYRFGDFVSGGLSWTRPVRMGGAQVSQDFSMRPDLVTFPLPIVAGTAAAPSTVDVLVNGVQALSRPVPAGPFQAPQLPFVTGAGSVVMTVTNAVGQQVTTVLPFYSSARLLAPGLRTWSVEAGAVRRNWGLRSNDYGEAAASATYRAGLSSTLTVEAHAEGAPGLAMAGAGLAADLFDLAVADVAVAGGSGLGGNGASVSLGVERIAPVFSFGAAALFATPHFSDLAARNGDPVPERQISANLGLTLKRLGALGLSYTEIERRPLTALVGAVLPQTTTPGPQLPESGVANFTSARVLTANYSVQVGGVFLYATGFHDFARGGGGGATIGLTVRLGPRSSAAASVVANSGSVAYPQLQAQQSVVSIGDWGYQLYAAGGQPAHGFALGQYKAPWALVSGGVDSVGGHTTGRVDLQGALTIADNALFASNPIYDSFAVVDTGGVAGVDVQFENRDAGHTDARGRRLVPDLRAWDVNHLSIDPGDVPIDAQVPYTQLDVRPPDRSGVVVKFPIRKTRSALLVLIDESGHPLAVGSAATLQATGVSVSIGYDGQAFVENLSEQNRVVVQMPNDGRCVADFHYTPAPGEIPKIGPLTCRRSDR